MRHEGSVGPQSPLYLQLRELIRSKIENGEYPPGTAIPSVGTLAETYGIHRLSVPGDSPSSRRSQAMDRAWTSSGRSCRGRLIR